MPDTWTIFGRPQIVGPDLFTPPRKTLPAVDLVRIFNELRIKNGPVSKQDLVNLYLRILLMVESDEKSILERLLPNGKNINEYMYSDDFFEYCLRTHWKTDFRQRGKWSKKTSPRVSGHCIFSLISFLKGCTHFQAIEYVAETMKVDFSQRNTIQPNGIDGYTFIEDAHHYQPDDIEDVASWILGPYQESYDFFTKYGAYSFSLKLWKVKGEDPILLFMTRQRCKVNDKYRYRDTFIAPPWWIDVIYNLHLIHEQKNDIIFMHDDLRRIKDWNAPGINTWSGELAYVTKIDWSILKDRSVQYVFDPRRLPSCKIAVKLKKKFDEMGTELEFITHDDMKLKSCYEFNDLVKEYHGPGLGIDLKPKDKGIKFHVRTLRDLSDIKVDRQFIVHPLFGNGEFIVLYSAPGVGKSFVALDLSLMIAGGESIGGRLSSQQQSHKVFYIDGENDPNEFEMRLKGIIRGNYMKEKEILKNISWLCLSDPKNEVKLDLSDAEDRQKIEELVEGFDFLVLDNLGTLTPSQNEITPKVWMEISTWICSLKQKGIAVLLVHHENKAGGMSGTGKIAQNANLIISLSEPSEEEKELSTKGTMVKFQIPKARRLRDYERERFFLVYNDENGQIDRTVLSLDGSIIENTNFVTEREINEFGLNKLDIDILNKARNPNVEFITAGDFKDKNVGGRRGTTVTERLNRMVKLGLLEMIGKNKGAKYWAAGKEVSFED